MISGSVRILAVVVLAPAILVWLYVVLIFVRQKLLLRKFRGPIAFPGVGNCYTVECLSIFKHLASLRKAYGPLFTFFAFTKARLVVVDPTVARRVLSDCKNFPKGTDYTHTFSYVFGSGLVTSAGEKHKKDRAIFGKYFVRGSITKFAPQFNVIADQAIEDLMVKADVNGSPKPVNIEKFFAVCALRLFMKFATGADYRQYPEREQVICKAVSDASNATGTLVVFGLPNMSLLPQTKVNDKMLREIRKEFNMAIEKRRVEHMVGTNKDTEDCLNAMIAENMSEQEMFEHFTTLICAGHDTTAYFSSYLLYLLAMHQDVQDKLRAEVMAHFQGRKEVTPDDVLQLTYMAKVMQETLRFYAIIPAVTRVATEEVHIKEANVTIPKGVEVMIPMTILNRDPAIWENPSVFNPDRFEGKTTDFTSAKNAFFPFGYGSRTCIGNTLAQIESGILISKLMMTCKFEMDPNYKMIITAGISLTTKNGINVICRPLNSQ